MISPLSSFYMLPLQEDLNKIIDRFYHGQLSYSQARDKIEMIVDLEAEKVEREGKNEFSYRYIVLLGDTKKNAVCRLNRKKLKLDFLIKMGKMQHSRA